ncbi:hypothetical protein ROS62_08690, partial [Streptomyces sp. DSM 41972]|nr:hypothetical protein [Streptomyces sp. DSM 41972]
AFRLGGETPPLPCSAGVSFLPREREVPPPRPEGRGIHERNQMNVLTELLAGVVHLVGWLV